MKTFRAARERRSLFCESVKIWVQGCIFLKPDSEKDSLLARTKFSLIFIGHQERPENNRRSVKILHVVRDSLGQFHNGDQFITREPLKIALLKKI